MSSIQKAKSLSDSDLAGDASTESSLSVSSTDREPSEEISYSYFVILALPDIDDERRKQLLPEIQKAYQLLEERPHFPPLNEVDSSPVGDQAGYGRGINDTFSNELVLLTEQFPDLTFRLYYFSYDMTCLDTYKVQRGSISQLHHYVTQQLELPDGTVSASMDPDTLLVPGVLELD